MKWGCSRDNQVTSLKRRVCFLSAKNKKVFSKEMKVSSGKNLIQFINLFVWILLSMFFFHKKTKTCFIFVFLFVLNFEGKKCGANQKSSSLICVGGAGKGRWH